MGAGSAKGCGSQGGADGVRRAWCRASASCRGQLLIIALKLGNSREPGWAAFQVSSTGVFDFLVSPKQGGGLSHVNVYGVENVAPAPVPLPASALLLLGGVGGLAALRRRRKAA